MKVKVFSIYDVKAAAFQMPFFAPATGHAVRSFGDLVSDERSPVSRHPADYRLYELGTFDDDSGTLESLNPAKQVSAGNDFIPVAGKLGAVS